MAIDINEFRLPITPQEARSYLQKQTDSFGIFFDMDRILELTAMLKLDNIDISRKLRRIANTPRLSLKDNSTVIDALTKMGVPGVEFYTKGSKKPSISAPVRNSILNNAKYSDDVKEFVAKYDTWSSNNHNIGLLEGFAFGLPISKALSKMDHRMTLGRPTWSILSTSRITASNPGIQGVPRNMGEIICEPKGYTLVRCDSGQIEPRINFSSILRDDLVMKLIMHFDDAYFGILNYCLMTKEEEQACRDDFEANYKPLEITDDIKASRQNIKRLTNAGSYGSSNLGDVNAELAAAYEKKIVNHPKMLARKQKVRDDVNHGVDTFYGAFGTPVKPGDNDKYKKGDSGWIEHLIRCGINNPIQTTASELMMFSINEARKILAKAKDSHICFYKHDEACFYVSDEDMANGVGEQLSDITAYNVKGWIPIHADPLIGMKEPQYERVIL